MSSSESPSQLAYAHVATNPWLIVLFSLISTNKITLSMARPLCGMYFGCKQSDSRQPKSHTNKLISGHQRLTNINRSGMQFVRNSNRVHRSIHVARRTIAGYLKCSWPCLIVRVTASASQAYFGVCVQFSRCFSFIQRPSIANLLSVCMYFI